jgi:hypothetical protein
MDLVIQEKESALVIGTFGRAIWVLDDLKSLREVAANRVNKKITALPMNKAVQVKGLFIAPPGNIWTGFGTTFEGENRPFQKIAIPFYINDITGKNDSVQVIVKNNTGDTIRKLIQHNITQGLNYINWKLDEESISAAGISDSDESRGIPVLPGTYTVAIKYRGVDDSSTVQVISDPRFDLKPAVDLELYRYQKSVDAEQRRLKILFDMINVWEVKLKQIKENLNKQQANKNKLTYFNDINTQVKQLKLKGKDSAGDRQVGAWQSNRITPYSAIYEAEKVSMARIDIPSEQDLEKLNNAELLIDEYEQELKAFENGVWKKFINKFRN